MEHRIESARTQSVAVLGWLVDHPLTVELLLCGVTQDVQPDQSFEQVLVLHPGHGRLETRRRSSAVRRSESSALFNVGLARLMSSLPLKASRRSPQTRRKARKGQPA